MRETNILTGNGHSGRAERRAAIVQQAHWVVRRNVPDVLLARTNDTSRSFALMSPVC